MVKTIRLITISTIIIVFNINIYGLQGRVGSHDPTAIQKCGNTYWIFTTGEGIYSMYSSDLINWTPGRTPFTKDSYPSWIDTKVPGFDGHFWAPACKYMNGKYYLYYSCSTWGSKVSAIGLVTNETLNPLDPNYAWVDQGVVVSSNASSDANCIDPAIFQDNDGQYWLTYGSYFGGIRNVQIDSVSGKVSGSYRYPVASGNCEAPYVITHDDYYYLFINRGSCCSGVNSTYHIQVGRSESPSGPFLDISGVDLNNGGGSTILNKSGNFIGPGHVGYYVEKGQEWITYHYYDGDRNGSPTLAIGTMKWREDGWPLITNNFLEDGSYKIVNRNSQFVWQVDNENILDGTPVTQGAYQHNDYQKWDFKAIGNGFYTISPLGSDLLVQTTECSGNVGSTLSLGENDLDACEQWRIERTNQFEYIISSKEGNNVVNVPQPSFDEGVQLEISMYSYIASHYWKIQDTTFSVSSSPIIAKQTDGVNIFPNPGSEGYFTIDYALLYNVPQYDIDIYTLDGKVVRTYKKQTGNHGTFYHGLDPNIYIMRLTTEQGTIDKKLIIN